MSSLSSSFMILTRCPDLLFHVVNQEKKVEKRSQIAA